MITVEREVEAKKLCASGLQLGRVEQVVEKYWKAGPNLVCMTCYGIRREQIGGCGYKPQRCVICVGSHKVEDHQGGVARCKKEKRRICVHVIPKSANYDGTHAANFSCCTLRHSADMRVKKEKKTKKKMKEKKQAEIRSGNPNSKAKIENANAKQHTAYDKTSSSKANNKAETNRKRTSPGSNNFGSDTEMENKQDQSTQEPEEENLDLVLGNDYWAASFASSASPYENNKSLDCANSGD